jgi:hypothetical protein
MLGNAQDCHKIWPRFLFPTVWLGPIFLFDPLLENLGVQSLSAQIAAGNRRRLWSLLAAGLACGLMWEFWNYWAASAALTLPAQSAPAVPNTRSATTCISIPATAVYNGERSCRGYCLALPWKGKRK